LTFVDAPALLINASSVLALSAFNRMLRTRERLHELFNESEAGALADDERIHLMNVTERVETQAVLLLKALHSTYLALAGCIRHCNICDPARNRRRCISWRDLGPHNGRAGTVARFFRREASYSDAQISSGRRDDRS
jgi:hypothetical protein